MSDVVDLIEADHHELERLLEILEVTPTQRLVMLPDLAELLVAHHQAETAVVYPAIHDMTASGGADSAGGAVLREETGVRQDAELMGELVERLRAADPASEEFDVPLAALSSRVLDHVAGQERQLLPFVRDHVDERGRVELGSAYASIRAEQFRLAARPRGTGVPRQRTHTESNHESRAL